MASIHKYDDVDLSNINYSKPEKIGSSYSSSISYGDNLRPLYIQTPKLKSIINLSDIKVVLISASLVTIWKLKYRMVIMVFMTFFYL